MPEIKTQIPAELAVIVCEVRQGSQLWPMLRIDQRADGHVHFTSGQVKAPQGLRVLQEAFQLCLTETTLQALQAARSNESPAESPQTAAPPGSSQRSDVSQGHSGAAASTLIPLEAEDNTIITTDNP